jgi:hypothetical protein
MEKEKLKNAVRLFYDLQELRMQAGNRAARKTKDAKLDDHDRAFLDDTKRRLSELERNALKEVSRLLKNQPIWDYLQSVRGVGPTMAGVLIAEIDISRCNTVSQLWAYCGLAVGPDGKAVRKRKGEKLSYNPWLKTKIVKVLGDSFIKSCAWDADIGYCTPAVARDDEGHIISYVDEDGKRRKKMIRVPLPEGTVPYRKFYDERKHRQENKQVDTCMACQGKKVVVRINREEDTAPGEKKPRVNIPCPNCKGGTEKPLWGASKEHRHKDAIRYMVKMFLLNFWVAWRKLEGLDVRAPYAEEYLNRRHAG